MSAGGSICWIGGQQLIALNNKIQFIPLLPSRSVSWSTVSVVGQTTTFRKESGMYLIRAESTPATTFEGHRQLGHHLIQDDSNTESIMIILSRFQKGLG